MAVFKSRHQDLKSKGNALSIEDHKADMEIIREIGANTLRLAHYQHAQEFYDLCDENGLVVWAEIPYITLHMTNGRQNTLDQMRELITQCYNHPSIAVWGLSNEITDGGADAKEWMRKLGNRMKLWHVTDRGSRQSGPAMTPILKADSMELGTGNMDLDGLRDIALANGIEAVVLESHKNWIDKDPVKSLELSAKWLNERF